MLEFIIGRACTGKTYSVIKRVAEISETERVILIVPEQFSFETERAIIKYPSANAENIKVLSFSRLLDEICETMGRGRIHCVSDFEKIILTRRALSATVDSLTVFGKLINYKEFPQSLYSVIRDFKMASVDADSLKEASISIGGTCGAKLNDISMVMSAYDAMLDSRFIDSADALIKACELLNDCSFFGDCHVFIDSFSGFTGQQYNVITRILEQAKETVFSFTTDDPSNLEIGLFYNINTAINRIKSIARSRGIYDYKMTLLDKHFYSNDAMLALEQVMSDNQCADSVNADNKINIISCENKREEALAAANIIRREVSENGYRFKDFIVVSRNADDYASNIAKQCKNNDIACFMDKSIMLTETPLGIYLVTLIETAKSFSSENILRLLKLKLSPFTEEEISSLEDYIFIWGIKGSDWLSAWEMSVNGLRSDDDSDKDVEYLERLNALREKIVSMLNSFRSGFVGSAKERASAVYKHLTDEQVDIHLSELCDYFDQSGDGAYSSLLKQSWDYTINVLNSIVRAYSGESISTEEFETAFEIASASAKISNIPQMLDEVTFGGAERIRPSKPKISIILGANQGVFPKISEETGILSKTDKDRLSEIGIITDDEAIKGAVEENFLVYTMLCCPVDKVYVLYSKLSSGGEELSESAFVSRIENHFEDLKVKNFRLSSTGDFAPMTAKSAFCELGATSKEAFEDIKKSLEDYPEYIDRIEMINRDGEIDFSVSPEASRALFGNTIKISPTKFDTYHKCSLWYLLQSGLRAKTLEKADLNVLQRGTITHYVLENLINQYRERLADCSELQISAEVDSLIAKYFEGIKGSSKLMTARFAYLLEKISVSVKRIACHIAEEFRQSDFVPKYCELTIGDNSDIPKLVIPLDDGAEVALSGKIDRVDVYKNNVRVVDYKTKALVFNLSDTLVGLNMQMLLYLYTFVKNGTALIASPEPAGVLYMPAQAKNDTKTLHMNGLISSEEEIRLAMEKDNKGVFVPKFSHKSAEYADKELFPLIFKKMDSLMMEMGNNIRRGNFSVNPTDGLEQKACDYCPFGSVCRGKDIKHNCPTKYTNDEIIEILKEGENNGF